MARIGVFLCHCGSNIGGVVDIPKVAQAAGKLPYVVFVGDDKYICSERGQDLIRKAILQHRLNRVVIGSCSPRMHESTFRTSLSSAGLNPYFLEIANLREQCSWVHRENKQAATEKAVDLIKMKVFRVYHHEALLPQQTKITKQVLVIGGGIAGIQAALDIAHCGYKVILVEKEASIGGRMAQLDRTFPTLDCSACILTPRMLQVALHPNITLLTSAQVEKVSGFVGNFKVQIKKKARYVDITKCKGCGECTNSCPVRYIPQSQLQSQFQHQPQLQPQKIKEITLEIDGKKIKAKEKMTILQAAKSEDVYIPTLCYHPAVLLSGGCGICCVEIADNQKSKIVTSCTYLVEEGLVVNTKSPKVIEVRKLIIEKLLARAPKAKIIQDFAKEYGVENTKFAIKDPENLCILCGLCVRICKERIGPAAIRFRVEGGERKVETPLQRQDTDSDNCLVCGACVFVCPTGTITLKDITKKEPLPILSDFDAKLVSTAPIHIPFPQAVPNAAIVDQEKCVHFITGKCKICQDLCPDNAINFDQEDEIIEVDVGAIVVATGYQPFDPKIYTEYGYGRYQDVITAMQMERLMSTSGPTGGEVLRPSDGNQPKTVAFICCVGSRDMRIGRSYCSKVCCMYTAKHVIILKEYNPDVQCYVFYVDIRASGKDFDEFYRRAQEECGALYIRGRVSKIYQQGKKLIVVAEDTLIGKGIEIAVDLVVLAIGMEPNDDAVKLAQTLNISYDANSLFIEAHPKLRPVETHIDGIFLAGACIGPKDIPESVANGSSAAAKVVALFNQRDTLTTDPLVAKVNPAKCSGCLLCVQVCPFSTIESQTISNGRTIAQVNETTCKGCGLCAASCRAQAVNLHGFSCQQLLAEVTSLFT